MHAIVNTEHLAAALKMSCAPAKGTIEALAFARIASEGNNLLSFETTDTEIHVRTLVDADVKEGGVIAVRADLLRNIAAESGQVLFRDEKVSRGRSQYRVPHMPPGNFFGYEDTKWQPAQLDAAALREALKTVAYAAAADDVRPQARGVHVVNGMVWAADGKNLGRMRIDYDGPTFVIPVARVARVIDALATGAELFVGNCRDGSANALQVRTPTIVLSLRLMQAMHWDVSRIIYAPDDAMPRVRLNVKEFQQALRRFLPFSEYQIEKGIFRSVTLEGTGADIEIVDRSGDSREYLGEAVIESKGRIKCPIDPKQMLDMLGGTSAGTIDLWPAEISKTATRHTLIEPVADDGREAHMIAGIAV